MGGTYGGGEGHTSGGLGHYGPTNGRFHRDAGNVVAAEAAGAAAAEAPRSAGSVPSRVRFPLTTLIRCAH